MREEIGVNRWAMVGWLVTWGKRRGGRGVENCLLRKVFSLHIIQQRGSGRSTLVCSKSVNSV